MTESELASDTFGAVFFLIYAGIGVLQMLYYSRRNPGYPFGNLLDHMIAWPIFVVGGFLRWRVWRQIEKLKPDDAQGFIRLLGLRNIQRVDHECQKVTFYVQFRSGKIHEYVITDWAVANAEQPRSYLHVLAWIILYGGK